MISKSDIFSYTPNKAYEKSVAYFSMEFAIDQSLKIYSGGLGFLAGSHMRSAYELKQNVIGIGMLWKFGYYDQQRSAVGEMKAEYIEKRYHFLVDTGVVVPVEIHSATVYVKAFLLKSEVFKSAPLLLLSTDIDQNDPISRTITNKLYDSNEATRIAQSIVLGVGGSKVIDALGIGLDIYHMNEGHAVPLCFYLYSKFKSLDFVKSKVVFTTHTPEAAGNEERGMDLLHKMSFFSGVTDNEVRSIMGDIGNRFNYTLAALKMSKICNAVSKMHGDVSRDMWKDNANTCDIISITNAQNKQYWKDEVLEKALAEDDNKTLLARKKEMKADLFKVVADQTGKIFDPNVLTLVWARRFAGYKRADLIAQDFERFSKLVHQTEYPIQIIWAGKPYPEDYGAIYTFNQLFWKSLHLPNVAILTGYELNLSAILKKGSDVWLNNPKLTREASGTSGMTAAMNGCVNFSIPDGWIPEFAKHGKNCFLIEPAPRDISAYDQDIMEANTMHEVLQQEILPTYYKKGNAWVNIVKQAMQEVSPAFESGRMAKEYYSLVYNK